MTPATRFLSLGFERSKMVAAMKARGLSAILLTSPENVFYVTGYATLPSAGNPILYMLRNRLPFFSFITGDGKVTLFCWAFSTRGMEFGADEVIGINNLREGVDAVRSTIARAAWDNGQLGIESTCPYFVLDAVRKVAGPRAQTIADDVLNDLREIKTSGELESLRRSLGIIEATCGELYDQLRIGMGRSELTREAKTRLMHNGANGISHLTFSFGTANPEFEVDERLEANRLVTLDLGAVYRGYCSDNRRYAYSGTIPSELREQHQAMVAIVDGVGAALRPGTDGPELMDLARRLYASHGVKPLDRFNHVGHNIGIETEERWLDETGPVVRTGMVINIELYSVAATGDQIGDEETYRITEDGSERLSQLPREIREIG